MVEPASPIAGVDIRRDYALNRRRLCRVDLEIAQVESQRFRRRRWPFHGSQGCRSTC